MTHNNARAQLIIATISVTPQSPPIARGVRSYKMCSSFLDPEAILLGNEQWIQLDEKWGEPVDLETDEDLPSQLKPVFSTLDLMKTTFDSSFMFKKVRRKVGRRLSKAGVLDYKDFLQDLQEKKQPKDFYYINGQILSAASVEQICDTIDDIFKSVEKLSSATSTVRKNPFPDKISCSISIDDLSFDDTPSQKETTEGGVDRYIDEAFEKLSHLSNMPIDDEATRASVTTLVRRFSSILRSPGINCSPRRQRQCCNNFKELAEFWKSQAFNDEETRH
ncbi:unnamed protein product [Chrysodeixis includens]|uniref:Uncharacterized protein n=1 Tax=Chrysodeixis includens TaxID=689277 RepID=A0A9P0C570_CHRIL|nr:unnamed protein product [Chrysodeixis includens]